MKHNSIAPLRFNLPIRRAFSAISIVLSLVFALAAFGNVGTAWTYQGQLRRSGAAYNGTCNFQFTMWNGASTGSQIGSPQSINGVNVANGLFTVVLDFGTLAGFTGDARWLQTAVQCTGDGGFTTLNPRQPITATPYAQSLMPGAFIYKLNDPLASLTAGNDAAGGLALQGVGHTGVHGRSSTIEGRGVLGSSTGGSGSAGVYGENTSGGRAGEFAGPVHVEGTLTANKPNGAAINVIGSTGVIGNASGGGAGSAGVFGENTHGPGVVGRTHASNSNGVSGSSGTSGKAGVFGTTSNTAGSGVYGEADGANAAGVFGVNTAFAGVWGRSTGAGPAVYGEATGTGYAGYFRRNVVVEGTLTKAAGTFRIDHPLDPANKFLSHSFVESPDMMNIYNGVATLDAQGQAVVKLPDYFDALNRDFRYQLTCIGGFAPVYVAEEITQNQFRIGGGTLGVKVSWQVTGIRKDAYAKANPIVVEEFKPAAQQGMYLYPAGFGAGEEKRISPPSLPATAPGTPATGPGDQAPRK